MTDDKTANTDQNSPGSTDGTSGRKLAPPAIRAFVRAVDQLDFEQIALQEEPLAALMGQLLVAALETISEQPEFLASDPNVRDLVSVTTTALATDIAARLEQAGTTDEADDIRAWGELVFRSVLRSGARHVLEHPGTLLGVESD